MMKYQPDGCYLVCTLPQGSVQEDDFALRMLSENRIEGILQPQIRIFNGERNLYYHIGSLQSLQSLGETKPLKGAVFQRLLCDLYGLCDVLGDYCLMARDLDFSCPRIYTDGDRFSFCYRFERSEDDPKEAFYRWTQELLSLIDHDDEDAVVYAYQLYKLAAAKQGDLRSLLEKVLGNSISEDMQSEDVAGMVTDRQDKRVEASGAENIQRERSAEDHEDRQEKGGKGNLILFFLFLLLSLTGAGLLVLRVLRIHPVTVSLLLAGRDGIGGLIFLLAGIAGAAFSLLKKPASTCEIC
ncbi:MAG: DUF6382 domain-containing protein [Lachnospiraceae bacterium]|nr:DUF6382 domain-containing protein [Lachnospiraceae bacterium]